MKKQFPPILFSLMLLCLTAFGKNDIHAMSSLIPPSKEAKALSIVPHSSIAEEKLPTLSLPSEFKKKSLNTSNLSFSETSKVSTSSTTVRTTATLQIVAAALKNPPVGLCSFDGTLRAIDGTYVINLANSAGKGITWKMEVASAGTYALKWRYASGGSSAAETAKLMVNGSDVVQNLSFPRPQNSKSFLTTESVNVSLVNGVNEVRIETTQSSAFMDIQWIEVTGDNPQEADCSSAIGSGGGTDVTYSVSVANSPSNAGSVSLDPANGPYPAGSQVTLTAVPANGYEFTSWSGDVTGTNPVTTVTVNQNMDVTANFSQVVAPVTYTLQVATIGQGTVNPSSGTYAEGESVSITATPAAGWQFSSWSGDASGNSNPLVVSMTGNKSITATFTQTPTTTTLRLEDAATPSTGYCSVDGAYETEHSGASNGGYLNTVNAAGSGIVWKVEVPAAGSYHLKWRYANASGDRTAKLLVDGTTAVPSLAFGITGAWTTWATTSETTVSLAAGVNTIRLEGTTSNGLANIDWMEIRGENPVAATCGSTTPVSVSLTTSVSGQGAISPDQGTYTQGETITLTATPASGWQFVNWSGDASGTTNPLTITMDGSKNVTAIFQSSTTSTPVADTTMIGYASVPGEGYNTTTGGQGGASVTISTLAELQAWALSRENNSTPEIAYISGKISASSTTVVTIKHGANVSVLGVGSTAELQNVGLNFRNYKNVIVKNLKIHEVFYPNDALTIDQCQHVWVDHCEFYSKIGDGIGVDTYDGLLDIKNGSRYVTVSWSYFHDHMKNILIGHTDNSSAESIDRAIRVTFHHNYFLNTNGRNPSLRWGAAHIFNNYFKNITDYGLAARQGAHSLVENNIYENVKLPLTTNKFTGEGFICERGNVFTGTSGANSITQTDCAWWNSTNLPYEYSLDPVSDLYTLIPENVGVQKSSTSTQSASSSMQTLEVEAGKPITVYPNPGKGNFTFLVTLAKKGKVTIQLYNLSGTKVAEVDNKIREAGENRINFFAPGLKPGLYIYTIETESGTVREKLMVE